ncbi:hypothetical protein F2Q69_00024419 [Brassica cretica]|uniref:Uncharacterized protein n=1 Tax=Brassica cretica TaxID=69181 RepID=A0A8S9Q1I5_BRACR|nr:hypothetical protein F2Q69_00024419 [Brassica cretica]
MVLLNGRGRRCFLTSVESHSMVAGNDLTCDRRREEKDLSLEDLSKPRWSLDKGRNFFMSSTVDPSFGNSIEHLTMISIATAEKTSHPRFSHLLHSLPDVSSPSVRAQAISESRDRLAPEPEL